MACIYGLYVDDSSPGISTCAQCSSAIPACVECSFEITASSGVLECSLCQFTYVMDPADSPFIQCKHCL